MASYSEPIPKENITLVLLGRISISSSRCSISLVLGNSPSKTCSTVERKVDTPGNMIQIASTRTTTNHTQKWRPNKGRRHQKRRPNKGRRRMKKRPTKRVRTKKRRPNKGRRP